MIVNPNRVDNITTTTMIAFVLKLFNLIFLAAIGSAIIVPAKKSKIFFAQ